MMLLDTPPRPTILPARDSSPRMARSTGVLLGTIVATGAFALSAIFIHAPTNEALLLVGALLLPWGLLAIATSVAIAIASEAPRPVRVQAPARPIVRRSVPSFRMAGAAAALALLLIASVIAQHSVPDSAPASADFYPGTTAQAVTADMGVD